ncbi:sialidase family protein [Beggiatoa leptomitoformis]|uniref:Sortilin N-terminal domain-containing protein n=1 Tax=Beggiatoa leptomitoformis TaxID=288004 RepID=A0A2N9YGA7_9GAMM|nr:hypothetical protein [Beggiatoa leptomitoformis]ALG68151.1 hypothetical protein AL038_11070 [Beggiatoa leptomitoformis]AUI69552.1 hypothetical protein BLE401_13190 [Beggiatoa leptomitoformis]
MRFYLSVLSLLGTFCLVVPSSWAGENEWTTPKLPDGGTGILEIDASSTPVKLILSSSYKSIDKGESWLPYHGFIQTMASTKKDPTADVWYGMNPQTDESFYKQVGPDGEWVKVVADEGFVLPPISPNIPVFGKKSGEILAIAPTQPATIYVRIYDAMYRSQDGGKRWYKIYSLTEPKTDSIFMFKTLLVDPSSPNTLYILGQQNTDLTMSKLYTSSNAGEEWTETAHSAFKAEWYPSLSNDGFQAVATTPTTFYINIGDPVSPKLLKTTATGNTWETLPIPPLKTDRSDFRQNYRLITLVPGTKLLYAIVRYQYDASTNGAPLDEDKLYKTTDSGAHWTELTSDLFPPGRYQLLIDPEDENILYVATGFYGVTGQNILKSVDGGEHWQVSKNGLGLNHVVGLFSSPTTTYAQMASGELFQITDKGETWTKTDLLYPAIRFQAINTTQEATKVYGYTTDCKSLYVKQQGQDAVFYPLPAIFYQCGTDKQVILQTVPYDTKTLYAIVPTGSGNNSSVDAQSTNPFGSLPEQVDKRTTPQILKSTDDGATWTTLYTLLKQREFYLVPDPITPKTLYAGVYGLGIMQSVDDGTTWELLTNQFSFLKFKVLPTTPRTFFLGLGDAFSDDNSINPLKSTDGGMNWVANNHGLNTYITNYDWLTTQENSRTLYINTGTTIYKTDDVGELWCPATSPIGSYGPSFFAKDLTDTNTFYAIGYVTGFASYTATTNVPTNQLGSYNWTTDTVSGAVITGKIQFDGCETAGAGVRLPLSTTVEIQGSIEPLPEHVGQTADIVVYARYWGEESIYFMLGENTIQVWDEQATNALSTLIPFKQGITLQAKNDINLYQGQFIAAGGLSIFFGYRLADGTVITNQTSLDVFLY